MYEEVVACGVGNADCDTAAALFVVALVNLHRSAILADNLTGGALRSQLVDFERAAPEFKTVRNIVEHFDAYEMEKGHEQKRTSGRWLYTTHDGTSHTVVFDSGLTLNLTAAHIAATVLLGQVIDALDAASGPRP